MITDVSSIDFLEMLSSKAPVPGGGSASAFVGALGTSLAGMVANLTKGKKKYAEYEKDVISIIKKVEKLIEKLALLMEKDIEVFEPLSKAYSLPKDTPEEQKRKDEIMEVCLKNAAAVPLEIMETVTKAIDFHEELLIKGSRLAISDVGVGIVFCKAAIQGASLNIFINTKYMRDREHAKKLNDRANEILENTIKRADNIFINVYKALKN